MNCAYIIDDCGRRLWDTRWWLHACLFWINRPCHKMKTGWLFSYLFQTLNWKKDLGCRKHFRLGNFIVVWLKEWSLQIIWCVSRLYKWFTRAERKSRQTLSAIPTSVIYFSKFEFSRGIAFCEIISLSKITDYLLIYLSIIFCVIF